MKTTTKILFCLIFILCQGASAAEYYVDFVGGADTNNGTGTATAFQHCPGDDNATDTAGSTTLVAGDTVYFKGGVQYNGQVDIDWSGTSGSRITYDGNTAGTWGTGRAIIDGQDVRYFGFYWVSARSYITIDNFEVRNMAHTDTINGVAGIGKGADGVVSDYITIQNCYIHNIGHWGNDGATVTGAGIKLFRAENSLIDNNIIQRVGVIGVSLSSPSEVVVSNNDVSDYISWCIQIDSDYGMADNNTISSNTMHDFFQHSCWANPQAGTGPADFWQGADCSGLGHPHTNGVFLRHGASGQVGVFDTLIDSNTFYNDYDFETSFDGSGFINLSNVDDTIASNNVLVNAHAYPFIYNTTSRDTTINNNTVYSFRENQKPIKLELDSTNFTSHDNLIVGGRSYYDTRNTDDLDDITSDYNYFAASSVTNCFATGVGCPAVTTTFENWKTNTSQDINSTEGTHDAVLFTDVTGFPTLSSTMDLTPLATSPVCGNGTDGGDIGAIECVSAPPSKPITPSPADNATDITLTPLLSWADGGTNAATYSVYLGIPGWLWLVSDNQTGLTYTHSVPLPRDTVVNWRIDATNDNSTVTGDVWSFTTINASAVVSNINSGGLPISNVGSGGLLVISNLH